MPSGPIDEDVSPEDIRLKTEQEAIARLARDAERRALKLKRPHVLHLCVVVPRGSQKRRAVCGENIME